MFTEESTAQRYAAMLNASGTGCKDATVHFSHPWTGYHVRVQVPGVSSRDGLVYTEEMLFNTGSVYRLIDSLR